MSQISFSKTWSAAEVLFAADLEAMKAAITSAVNGGLDNGNMTAAADIALSKLSDYSADATEMQTQANPYPSDVISLSTDLRGELAKLRWMIAKMMGTTYWYQGANLGIAVHTTGDLKWTIKTAADTGWILMNDGTISNAAPGAGTTRANADTAALYSLLWTNFSDALCPVSTGRGASAAADFAANKTIALPAWAGRSIAIAGTPRATNTFETIVCAALSSADATHITLDPEQKFLTTDIISGYTLLVTSGVRINETATVSSYASTTGIITIGAGLTGALGVADTFTLTKVITTRTLGQSVGKGTIIPVGNLTISGTGGTGTVAGFGSTVPSTAAGTVHEITNYSPTAFGNVMVKL